MAAEARRRKRLPTETLRSVRSEHIHQAVAELLGRTEFHPFGPSTDYDLVTQDGALLPPKAVFGLAATKSLGFDVLPGHFSAGPDKPAFQALEAAGYRIVQKAGQAAAKKNPDWTREETILALDLYVRRRPQLPDQKDEEVQELSQLLRMYAHQRSVVGLPNFRNPDGVSMKIANLSRLEETDTRAGLSNGSKMEEQVWAEFGPDMVGLAYAANLLRAEIVKASRSDLGAPPSANSDVSVRQGPSRGPAPSFGAITFERQDGETLVSVMKLEGPIGSLFPKLSLAGKAIVKVGRTNDTARRVAELNDGFPPGADLTWKLAYIRRFSSGQRAHDAEQQLLSRLASDGTSLGREFALVTEKELPLLLGWCADPPA